MTEELVWVTTNETVPEPMLPYTFKVPDPCWVTAKIEKLARAINKTETMIFYIYVPSLQHKLYI